MKESYYQLQVKYLVSLTSMMEIALEENRDKDALNLINMLKSSSDNELSFLKNNKEFIKILDAYK